MPEKYFPLKDEAWEDELFDEIQRATKFGMKIMLARFVRPRL